MVSDDELARHVESFERAGGSDIEQRVGQLEEHAHIVHDELMHRIESTRANAATRDDLSALVERLDAIEDRLDDLEATVDDCCDDC
ncbi:hypothetical protein [Halorarius litoreus]|uniref:hypothetical protein n=1 Tax=Halorarius litoreus TaxID=2962676 RepID=UPI0020CB6B04|nr:hypothetical protein [Halorarius litoreus]